MELPITALTQIWRLKNSCWEDGRPGLKSLWTVLSPLIGGFVASDEWRPGYSPGSSTRNCSSGRKEKLKTTKEAPLKTLSTTSTARLPCNGRTEAPGSPLQGTGGKGQVRHGDRHARPNLHPGRRWGERLL